MANAQKPSDLVNDTLEDILHNAHDDLALLTDLFELQAVSRDPSDYALSSGAMHSLTRVCRRATTTIRHALDSLPAELLNHPTGSDRPKRRV